MSTPHRFALALALLAGSTAQAATLTNGSFEDLTFSLAGGYCYLGSSCAGTAVAWTGTGQLIGAGNGAWGNPSALAGWDSAWGDVVAGLQNGSDLDQTLSFAAPGHYRLSWVDAGRPGYYATEYGVLLDGTTLGTYATAGGQGWTAHSIDFTVASAGSYTLRFDGHAINPDGTAFLDHVALSATAAPVPEPSSALMALSGLAALGVARLRRGRAGGHRDDSGESGGIDRRNGRSS